MRVCVLGQHSLLQAAVHVKDTIAEQQVQSLEQRQHHTQVLLVRLQDLEQSLCKWLHRVHTPRHTTQVAQECSTGVTHLDMHHTHVRTCKDMYAHALSMSALTVDSVSPPTLRVRPSKVG